MQTPKRVRVDLNSYRSRHSPSSHNKKRHPKREQYQQPKENPRTALEQDWAESDRKFRQSLEKVQQSVLGDSRRSKQMTAKTFKEVGKEAQRRKKLQKNLREEAQLRHREPVPKPYDFKVELYGFKSQKSTINPEKKDFPWAVHKTPPSKPIQQKTKALEPTQSQSSRQKSGSRPQVHIDRSELHTTYSDFEQDYSQALSKSRKQERQAYQRRQQQRNKLPEIRKEQIDVMVSLFELGSKLNEEDTLSLYDIYCILQQLQRRHLIKTLQDSQVAQQDKDAVHSYFVQLLKRLQQQMKIVYCRKQQQNIYDMLYHLHATEQLASTTQLLTQIFDNSS